MRILLWHVHGSWTTAFVQGPHDYVVPVVPDRGPDGVGRARTWDWPASVVELAPEELRGQHFDVVIAQRPRDYELLDAWGVTGPRLHLEHNAPQGRIAEMEHVAAGRDDVERVVHVTHFNDLFWDCGDVPTTVVEHGIVDPGERYTGELPRVGVVINEARRRRRVTGTDLLERFEQTAPVDLFGMDAGAMGGFEDLPQDQMHEELARRRVYLHPIRWTSLGLALLEAMHLGMPVVALGTTEVHEAVPPEAGVVSTKVDVLQEAVRRLVADPDEARERGAAARRVVLERYGLDRFLSDWDRVLEEVV